MPEPAERLAARRRAHLQGRLAEHAAAMLLRFKGFRPLHRRYLAPGGEIDLVMRRGPLVVFVEVKARRDMADAQTAVTQQKVERMTRAIRHWQSRHGASGLSYRADAVFIAAWRLPRHVPRIFDIAL